MDNDVLIAVMTQFAERRKSGVDRGLESPELAALLVEKYAVGMVDAAWATNLDVDINELTVHVDKLCNSIDPQCKQNRKLRYERITRHDLSHRKH